jgi:hypothetical protein
VAYVLRVQTKGGSQSCGKGVVVKREPIKYNGFYIYPILEDRWEVVIDGQSIVFDSLSYAKARIDYWTK